MKYKKLELGADGNTIALMCCLKDNPGKYCCEPVYFHNKVRCIVSSKTEKEMETYLQVHSIDTWFDYQGMKRLHLACLWFLFCIDGKYYFANFI